MNLSPPLLALTLLASVGILPTAESAAPVVACNLKAISSAERPRYNDLFMRIRDAARHRSEIANGYAFRLDGKAVHLQDIGEWISMERRCCPFLTFELSASGDTTDCVLKLTGPEGVRAVLQGDFPEWH